VNGELGRILKKKRSSKFKVLSGIRLERLRKTIKDINSDSVYSGRDLSSVPPEYEAGVLTTPPRR
jgi:hypothetical protein